MFKRNMSILTIKFKYDNHPKWFTNKIRITTRQSCKYFQTNSFEEYSFAFHLHYPLELNTCKLFENYPSTSWKYQTDNIGCNNEPK